jgi:hypothetical protein
MTVFQPSDNKETQQVIAWAAAEGQPLDITAGAPSGSLAARQPRSTVLTYHS